MTMTSPPQAPETELLHEVMRQFEHRGLAFRATGNELSLSSYVPLDGAFGSTSALVTVNTDNGSQRIWAWVFSNVGVNSPSTEVALRESRQLAQDLERRGAHSHVRLILGSAADAVEQVAEEIELHLSVLRSLRVGSR